MRVMAYGADDWGSDDENIPKVTHNNTFFHGFINGIVIGIVIGFTICKMY